MLEAFLGTALALYLTAWIILIAVAYDSFQHNADFKDYELLLAVFVGPVFLLVFIPELYKMVAGAIFRQAKKRMSR